MRGPQSIYVVPFHYKNIPEPRLVRDSPARLGRKVMPVDPLEDDRAPVHEKAAVSYLDLPEAEADLLTSRTVPDESSRLSSS